MDSLARQNIEVFARYLYEIEGCPKGRSEDYWFSAERQLSEIIFQKDRPIPAMAKVNFRMAKASK